MDPAYRRNRVFNTNKYKRERRVDAPCQACYLHMHSGVALLPGDTGATKIALRV